MPSRKTPLGVSSRRRKTASGRTVTSTSAPSKRAASEPRDGSPAAVSHPRARKPPARATNCRSAPYSPADECRNRIRSGIGLDPAFQVLDGPLHDLVGEHLLDPTGQPDAQVDVERVRRPRGPVALILEDVFTVN